jgi:cobalt-zinc-cadmium resistance protein CzcA
MSTGIGSQVQRPLATVVVGGLALGSIVLMVVVPALQMLLLGRERPLIRKQAIKVLSVTRDEWFD